MYASALSAVLAAISIIMKLPDIVKNYEKKKKTQERVVRALRNETENYLDLIDQAISKSKEQMSVIDLITKDPSTPYINRLISGYSELTLIYSKIVEAFVKLAKACSEIAFHIPFMKDLEESDRDMYAFIEWMSHAYDPKKDQVLMNGKFYRYIKLYEDRFFEGVKEKEIQEIVGNIKDRIQRVIFLVKKKRRMLNKKILKDFRRKLETLDRVSAKINVKDISVADIRSYIPAVLLPIIVLFEELSNEYFNI